MWSPEEWRVPGIRKGACGGRLKPSLAGVFGDQRGEAGDACFSVPGSGFAQSVLRIPVAGEGALADEVLRAAVGKAFREDFEFAGPVAGSLLGERGCAGQPQVKGVVPEDRDAPLVGDDLDLNGNHAAPDHVQLAGGGPGNVEDEFFLARPAVVDADEQVVPIGKVGHADDGPQRKGAVRRREFVLVVAFPIGCFLAVERVAVEGGSPGEDLKHGARRSAFRLLDGGQIKGKSQEQQGDGSFYHAYP